MLLIIHYDEHEAKQEVKQNKKFNHFPNNNNF